MDTRDGSKQAVLELEKEVELLRSFVIGVAGKDEEGDYKPEFVEKVFQALKEHPEYEFRGSRSFLEELQKAS